MLAFQMPLAIAVFLLCLILGVGLIRPLSTQITNTGVSQLTWQGRRYLPWSEVSEVKVQPQVITLIGQKECFLLPLMFFSNLDESVKFIQEHLPSKLRGVIQ